MNGLNHKKVILTIFSLFLIFFGLIQLSSFSFADITPKEIQLSTSYQMQEFAVLNGESNDTKSLDLMVSKSSWNLTDINLYFSNIHQKKNTQVFSGGSSMFGLIQKGGSVYGLANEIRLEQSISLSSVELFCYASEEYADLIYVQIQGYDPNTDLPNSTVYGTPILLNVSTSPNWYIQTFNSPISLPAGRYYLVINGSQLEESSTIYYWRYGESSVLKSVYYTTNWSITPIHYNLDYKLNQESKFYNPNEINMQVEIEGIKYDILEGSTNNSGILNVNDINFEVNNPNCSLTIYTNMSIEIYFDYSYEISLNNYFLSEGTLIIRENSYNSWNITPNIFRYGYNQSIRFKCSDDWSDINFYKDGTDITSKLLFEQGYYYIRNETISDGSDWLLTARSYLYEYQIDCSNDLVIQGGTLSVSLHIIEGNGIAVLKMFNSQGIEIYNTTKIIDTSLTNFNYTLPTDIPTGLYYVYIFWQNNVNAGVQSHAFYISSNQKLITIEPKLLVSLIMGVLILAGALVSYKVFSSKRKRRDITDYIRKDEEKTDRKVTKLYEKIISNKFLDLFNLKYIIISEKFSGLYVFEEAFQDVEFDPLLVSGFIGAIKSFGQEVINIETDNQILNIEYQTSNIYLVELSCFNFILIMGAKPSNEFLLAVDNLIEEIDYRYGHLIEGYQGDITKFDGIIEIIEKYLGVNLLFPFNFNANLNHTFTPEEKDVLYKAYDAMKQTNENYFYLSQILNETNFDLKTAEIILKFISQDIFTPHRE